MLTFFSWIDRYRRSDPDIVALAAFVENHPHLFQVNPGVDASLALEHASLFLAAAYDMASDAAQDEPGDTLWGMACLIEMAKSVVDSVSGGLIRGEDGQ